MLEDPALVPSMIAGAMGIAVQGEDPLAVILGHIRDRRFLLLLDNCEHVIAPAAEVVQRIMDAASMTRILATSREPLRIRDEHVHRLGALPFPDDASSLPVDELLAYPAVQLFCERASAADSSLEIDETAARLIGGMCSRLDGMALPIELAAVRVATHGISATARQLGERFSLGWPGRRTAQPRQQTLMATLDWSYELLSTREQLVLERLAIFVGPFSIDAALEVAADSEIGPTEVAIAIDELTSKSLVALNRSRDSGTYRLLEMTRAYAREKLRARSHEHCLAVARSHASFFLRELSRCRMRTCSRTRARWGSSLATSAPHWTGASARTGIAGSEFGWRPPAHPSSRTCPTWSNAARGAAARSTRLGIRNAEPQSSWSFRERLAFR
jgi:predicted ATPase